MPKQTARQRAMASGTLLCLAHPDGRLACAKTGKLLRGTTAPSGYCVVVIDLVLRRQEVQEGAGQEELEVVLCRVDGRGRLRVC